MNVLDNMEGDTVLSAATFGSDDLDEIEFEAANEAGESAKIKLSEPGKSLIRSIRLFAAQNNGRTPSWDDVSVLEEALEQQRLGTELSGFDRLVLWKELQAVQKSDLTCSDLKEIVRSKRESIFSIQASVEIRRTVFRSDHPAAALDKYLKFETTWSSGKFRVRLWSAPMEGDETSFENLIGFDGEKKRTYDIRPDGNKSGSIQPVDGADLQFDTLPANILRLGMLLDSGRLGRPYPQEDLVVFAETYGVLFSQPVEIDGASCLELSNGLFYAYVDPEINFAVRRFEERSQLGSPEKAYVRECFDFADCGNGIWLPSRVKESWYAPESKIDAVFETSFSGIQVNKRIADEVFTDIWPEGTHVQDPSNGVVYIAGRDGTISETLDRVIPYGLPPAARDRKWLIIGNLAVMMAVILAAWAVARSRRLRS
jgi:hypothetical protein